MNETATTLSIMEYTGIIKELSENRYVFKHLLSGLTKEEYLWKPNPEKWCLLEIICHLHDEDVKDFRLRTQHILETPNVQMPIIDPPSWVQSGKYAEQNYEDMISKFLIEREQSIKWLQSLDNPKWDNAYKHPEFGDMTAKMFLFNWVAHDLLHIRQILKLKHDRLKQILGESLSYAGEW